MLLAALEVTAATSQALEARAATSSSCKHIVPLSVHDCAGAGDLPPPPESMLTQPPPPAQTVLDGDSTASPSSRFGPSAGGSSFSSGRARTVGFAAATDVSVAGSGSSSNGRSNAGGGRGRPMLSISLDQASGTGLEDGSAPASAIGSVGSSKRMTPSQLQSVGRGDHSSAGRLKWGGEDRNSSSSSMAAAVMEQPPAATTAGAPGGQQLSTKQALGARRSKQLTGQRASVVSSHAGARHSSTAGVGANAPRQPTSLQATPNVHGASGCGPALTRLTAAVPTTAAAGAAVAAVAPGCGSRCGRRWQLCGRPGLGLGLRALRPSQGQ